MCPDPALLAAYLNGTLFSRDAPVVDQHTSTCARCAAILAAMRRERETAQRPMWSRPWTIGVAITVVAILGIGAWAARPGSEDAPYRETAPARSETGPPTDITSAALSIAATAGEGSKESEGHATTQPARRPDSIATHLRPEVSRKTQPKPSRGTKRADLAPDERSRNLSGSSGVDPGEVDTRGATDATRVDLVANPLPSETGVILRGRNASPHVLWRTRDRVVEHSTDGGATWAPEYTADRSIRAGAFVDNNVAWLVGENGLIDSRHRDQLTLMCRLAGGQGTRGCTVQPRGHGRGGHACWRARRPS